MKKTLAEIRSENFRLARIEAAKYHASPEGRLKRKQQAQKLQQNRPSIEKECQYCKKKFISKSLIERIFCQSKCKTAARRKSGIDNIEFECIVCNNKFMSNKYVSRLTCSQQCKLKQKSSTGEEGYIGRNGYRLISRPTHENSQKSGKILEHVFIMSTYLGRPLNKGESVHHKNGIRNDNRIENLELWHKGQPAGQRVEDKISWAKVFLETYGYQIKEPQ